MKKIYIVIAGVFLILLIVTSILLSFRKKSTTNNSQNNLTSPTSIPDQGRIGQGEIPVRNTGGDQGLADSADLTDSTNSTNTSIDTSLIAPVETIDFKMSYSTQLNKLVVEKKTPDAEQKFNDWATENNYPQLINSPEQIIMLLPGQAPPDSQPLLDFLNIFMNFGQGESSTNNTQSPSSISATPYPLQTTTSFTYFPQCGDFGETSLPDGCNLCQAGCGPTTVSMIARSYLGGNYDPKTVVNLYRSNGYLLGCDGSRYSDAKQILQSLGLKTTDYLVFNSEKSETVVQDLRKYLAGGWTFFALASFCEGGCGHYFWITDIDNENNIWAYDPAYGRYEIPYNENSRYPYPLYRLAFGVKK